MGAYLDKKADSAYHDWLVSLIDSPFGDVLRDYTDLCDCMDAFEFVPHHPWDENRIGDSLKRREFFLENVYMAPNGVKISRKFVTFFEFLVGILVDLSEISFVEPGDPSVAPEMFVDFLGETGLLGLDNDHFDRDFLWNFLCNFSVKSKKITIFGEKMDKKLDFWANFSTIFGKKYGTFM